MAIQESDRPRYTYQIRIVSNRGINEDVLYSQGLYLHSHNDYAWVVDALSRHGFWTDWAGTNRLFPHPRALAELTWIGPGAILWVKLARDRGK